MTRGKKEWPWRRFWRFVDKSGECWLWTGGRNNKGYGEFGMAGESVSAHRVSFELANGEIPHGLNVCHRCDVPACVNPAHLFLGTQRENMLDMIAKGRRPTLRKAQCRNGHPFTPENTRIHRAGYRICRECTNSPRRIEGGRGAYNRRAS